MNGTPEDSRGEDVRKKVVAAALRMAAEGRWRDAALADVAAEAEVSLDELRSAVSSKVGILAALIRDIDGDVLSRDPGFEDEDTPRDRLFEILMSRFDALAPHRDGIAALARDLPFDPLSGLVLAPTVLASMGWMLEAAGISSAGLDGLLRAKGLAAVWLATLRTWLADDDPDLSRTMAALDRNLRRAERFAMLLDRPRRIGRRFGPRLPEGRQDGPDAPLSPPAGDC